MRRSMMAILVAFAAASVGALPVAAQSYTETFDCKGKRCTNLGQWTFDSPIEGIMKETGHGKPRYFFFMDSFKFIPTLHTGSGVDSPFVGNYRERNVDRISMRTRLARDPFPCGTEGRKMTLALVHEGDPLSFKDDCAFYMVARDELGQERDIPSVLDGWVDYSWAIESGSYTLPEGWEPWHARCQRFDSDGDYQVDPDKLDEAWNYVITAVDQVTFCYERCDYVSIECRWAIHADDIAIEELP